MPHAPWLVSAFSQMNVTYTVKNMWKLQYTAQTRVVPLGHVKLAEIQSRSPGSARPDVVSGQLSGVSQHPRSVIPKKEVWQEMKLTKTCCCNISIECDNNRINQGDNCSQRCPFTATQIHGCILLPVCCKEGVTFYLANMH